jgi:predicted ATPase
MRTLAAIRGAGARVQEIVLAPLELDDVERLIADALRCGPDSAGPLALSIHEKTGGNPFFAVQFLTSLADEGLVRFDRNAAAPNKSNWTWDLDRIRGKGYSSNVVDLMLGKLGRLPDHAQTALQQLACLGNEAKIELLRLVFWPIRRGNPCSPVGCRPHRADSSFGRFLCLPPRPDSGGGLRAHPRKRAR